jgi:serine/threonine protein kinase
LGSFKDQAVAIKKIEFDEFVDEHLQYEDFRKEASLLRYSSIISIFNSASEITHPNIMALTGICLDPPAIITELMNGGDLQTYLYNCEHDLNDSIRLTLASDIAKGCSYLHNLTPPIVHRDLKVTFIGTHH